MKYYSEKTKKVYDDVKSLEAAEKDYDKSHELEVDIKKAWNDVEIALKKYNELVKQNYKNKKLNQDEIDEIEKIMQLFM